MLQAGNALRAVQRGGLHPVMVAAGMALVSVVAAAQVAFASGAVVAAWVAMGVCSGFALSGST